MQPQSKFASEPAAGYGSLLVLALLALIAGAGTGFIGAVFRLTLEQADRARNILISWAHEEALTGFLLVTVGGALAAGLAAWLVRRFSPYASGSGIPQVEAALNGQLPPAPPHLILVKFCGGVLAIGSGLALGREGPSVQIGAVIAHIVGKMSGAAGRAAERCWPPALGLGSPSPSTHRSQARFLCSRSWWRGSIPVLLSPRWARRRRQFWSPGFFLATPRIFRWRP